MIGHGSVSSFYSLFLYSLFQGRLDSVEQQARDMANADGTINPDAAMDNVSRQRRLTRMLWAIVALAICIILGMTVMGVGMKGTFNQGTTEVKDTILESTSTSIGHDDNGQSILEDVHTKKKVSVRAFGDSFATTPKVDPTTGRVLNCINIGRVAELFHDAISRTEASVAFVDENGIEKEVVPINGHFVDDGHTLHFGSGEESVTVIMDSDVCNTAMAMPDSVQNDEGEFEQEEANDGELTDEDSGVFKRGLREPSSTAVAVVRPVSPSDVLDRHRNEFAMAKVAIRNGRKMQTNNYTPICSGSDCDVSSVSRMLLHL